jgi:proline iminopeptidase
LEQPAALYPPIEPFQTGGLAVDSTHSIYYEQSGNPSGFPVLFLHGGPGSQVRPQHRQFFDPAFYRIVLFDQRGCGRSTPRGGIVHNTTWHLVADIEGLRRQLGVERWLLFGGSWGSALALAYAQSHPRRVAGLILRGVFLASASELDWYVNGLRDFLPSAWRDLTGGRSEGVVARYHAAVNHPDLATAEQAARIWVGYEEAAMQLGSGATPVASAAGEVAALLDRARVQLHYLANECFLRRDELLQTAWKVATVPCIIVQGRLDMICPPVTASDLAERLPHAELRMVESGGHSGSQPIMAAALRTAADDMRERLRT